MKQLPDKISRSLFRYGDFSVKLSVTLINADEYIHHNEFIMNDKRYLALNPFANIVFAINCQDEEWDPLRSIMITNSDMYEVVKAFKNYIKGVYEKSPFYKDNFTGKVSMYADVRRDKIVQMSLFNNKGHLIITPDLYSDGDDYSPGVTITINKTINAQVIPMQLFESLYYMLSKVDLLAYSQAIMNYVVGFYGAHDVGEIRELKKGVSFTQTPKEDRSGISTNIIPVKEERDEAFESLVDF